MGDGVSRGMLASATVPIAAGVSLIAAAVVSLCGEVIIEVAIEIPGAPAATRQVCKGQGLCHGEVGWFHCFVVHVLIIRGQGDDQAADCATS